MNQELFFQAKPIFLQGMSRQMNIQAMFRCRLPENPGTVQLRLAGATHYRVLLGGETVHYGPARTAAGYASVDTLTLCIPQGAELCIQVASYYCRTLSNVRQPGFLIAEVTADGRVLAATGTDSVESFRDMARVQKAMRFAGQRHFSEVYHGWQDYVPCPWEVVEEARILFPREMPLPHMEVLDAGSPVARGSFVMKHRTRPRMGIADNVPNDYADGFSLAELEEFPVYEHFCMYFSPADTRENPRDGYPQAELDEFPVYEHFCMDFSEEKTQEPAMGAPLSAGEYAMFEFGSVKTGFLMAQVEVLEDSRFFLSVEEYTETPWVSVGQRSYCKTTSFTLPRGSYRLEVFEANSLRYLQAEVLSGRIAVKRAGLRTFMFRPCPQAVLSTGVETLDSIFAAAVETFRQNTVDIFMDCPSRERAGWLCDSFFSARVERAFTGDNAVERAFLRNFARAGAVPGLPDGVLPMCYPSDVLDGQFIPQWDMWYFLELEEALAFSDQLDREEFRELCYRFLGWLSGYANADGLLERLPGWNFVEWSACNDWVQDVNYPTNFLYAATLEAAGRIYEDEALLAESCRVRENTVARSFDGTFFTDNAVYGPDGQLQNTGNTSETCQYYAIVFGKIDLEEPCYRALKQAIFHVFGGDRAGYAALGRQIEPSAIFIGRYLRMMLLQQLGLYDRLVEDVDRFFGYMARLTGTLWEHADTGTGSLNHGFASYAGLALQQAQEYLKFASSGT